MQRKPDWLKVKLPNTAEFKHVKGILKAHKLHSVCQEAACPNITECFHSGTATFLILGDICTRNCQYCNIQHQEPLPVNQNEPQELAQAVKELDLKYVVITSVTRDDLKDGGAGIFAECVEQIRRIKPKAKIELLIPDLQANWPALQAILASQPDVLNHNMEVVKRLFPSIRPQGDYATSLELLARVSQTSIISKSGFMVGVGEQWPEIMELLDDLRSVGCQRLTIGQYLQPSREHWPLERYYTPKEFDQLKTIAAEKGFTFVESGPLVRSSYHAAQAT